MIRSLIVFLLMLGSLTACQKNAPVFQEVYSNNFETNTLDKIQGGKLDIWLGNKVLGRYNNDGFSLQLSGLGEHTEVEVSFDLNIHDGWDGNVMGDATNRIGPDLWNMQIDGLEQMNTTFSNRACVFGYCFQQAYPQNYPYHNDPRLGASNGNLPGFCIPQTPAGGGTALYKIKKRIFHKKSTFVLSCRDVLQDSTVPDKLCEESWSIDNLVIKLINQ